MASAVNKHSWQQRPLLRREVAGGRAAAAALGAAVPPSHIVHLVGALFTHRQIHPPNQ